MNAEEGECNVKVAGKNCDPLDEIMISSSVSKVNVPRLPSRLCSRSFDLPMTGISPPNVRFRHTMLVSHPEEFFQLVGFAVFSVTDPRWASTCFSSMKRRRGDGKLTRDRNDEKAERDWLERNQFLSG
jgi:hypothetical protein